MDRGVTPPTNALLFASPKRFGGASFAPPLTIEALAETFHRETVEREQIENLLDLSSELWTVVLFDALQHSQ